MVLMYQLLVLGTDKRVITSVETRHLIMLALHFQLDTFSTELWHWGPVGQPTQQGRKVKARFNHYNAHKSLARLIHEFFPGEQCPEVLTWDRNSDVARVTESQGISDHHLNMISRINLIPPSHRGNQLKKYLAFMYLQTLAEVEQPVLPECVGVSDLTDSVQLCDKLSDPIRILVMSGNYPMTMTLLELYDIIVGHEKVDFADDTNRAEIMKLCEKVLKWIHKKLPGYSRGLDINDEKSVQSMQLQEFLDIIESRWKLGCA